MIDIIGEYPQAEAFYYKTAADTQTGFQNILAPLLFTGIHSETNVSHVPGTASIHIVKEGIYLIEGAVTYNSTSDGFATNIFIGINANFQFSSSDTEAQAETSPFTILKVFTFTDYLLNGTIITLGFLTQSPVGVPIVNGEYDTYIKLIRLR